MSELGDLEAAVVGLIAGLQDGEAPMFRSVEGFSDPDRRRAMTYISGRSTPAALVVYAGRGRADLAQALVGSPRLSVVLRAENLRGGPDVRSGDGTSRGGFQLLEGVMAALDGTAVLANRRLAAIDEQVVTADDTHVVYEQRYLIERVAEPARPTFNGVALAGADSLVNVVVGEAAVESIAFGFPGIDGEFRHQLGLRGRPIRWTGQLLAVDDETLNAIEQNIEAAVADPRSHDLTDALSRTFTDCVLERFARRGPRQRHPASGCALQPFELHFTQLNP
jgi:hypothetical protein